MRENIKASIFDIFSFGYLLTLAFVTCYRPTEEQLLNIEIGAIVTLICFIVGWVLTFVLYKFNVKTLGLLIFEAAHKKALGNKKSFLKSFWGWHLQVLFWATFIVSIYVTEFSFDDLFYVKGLEGAQRIFVSLITPNFAILPQGLMAIFETVFMAFMSTVIAVPIAFVLSFVCAKNVMGKTMIGFSVYSVIRIFNNIVRSIEPLIWAIIFSVWVGIGPFAGMLALMITSVASLTKQYSEFIEGVSEGPIEGIQSTGANSLQVIWYAIVPQIVLPYISYTIYRWDINVRMATIIGLVGGGGIGTMLMNYQGQALWHEVGTLALLIVIVVWAMDTASAYIREAIK
ncbi:MAG: phosphonate ABC transporter, permease protein PhnE [Bdellovibrionota bacterium]